MRRVYSALTVIFLAAAASAQGSLSAVEQVERWKREFPKGDFSKLLVPVEEFDFDGNTRDSIEPVTDPQYVRADKYYAMHPTEPVISIAVGDDARAYPLEMLLWHEIVNETIGGRPLLITYCPLCNSGVVFDRRVDGRLLTFGNTGRVRYFDMVMYDHQTESWWQQFSGRALTGSLAGQEMTAVASVVESLRRFRERFPDGMILVPNDPRARQYGRTPYRGMEDRAARRLSARWPTPDGIRPLDFVVVVGERAWPLKRLQSEGELTEAGLTFRWSSGRNSIHDELVISNGRDMGMVTVEDANNGTPQVHDIVFAFAYAAFVPNGDWMLAD